MELYHAILVNDPVFDNDADRDNAQRVFDRVSEALHYMLVDDKPIKLMVALTYSINIIILARMLNTRSVI